MDTEERIAIVDAGNTRIKVGIFQNGEIEKVTFFTLAEKPAFDHFILHEMISSIAVSSVLNSTDDALFFNNHSVFLLHNQLTMPFVSKYQSAATIGMDRLANIAAVFMANPKKPCVAMDLGTCIKFDFIDENGDYQGGSISPGLQMRYKALQTFTGNLPLLDPEKAGYLGNTTQDSMHAGVIHGMQGELNHFIDSYSKDYQGLTFFVTGGDVNFFEFPSKSNIFALENLTLKGLFYIYKLNA